MTPSRLITWLWIVALFGLTSITTLWFPMWGAICGVPDPRPFVHYGAPFTFARGYPAYGMEFVQFLMLPLIANILIRFAVISTVVLGVRTIWPWKATWLQAVPVGLLSLTGVVALALCWILVFELGQQRWAEFGFDTSDQCDEGRWGFDIYVEHAFPK